MDMMGKVAVVTGGGIGIGYEIARELSRRGARVVVTYRSHRPDREALELLRSSAGESALAVACDATDPDDVLALYAQVAAEYGTLDVLVNNAGGLIGRASIEEMSYEHWRTVMAVNLDSVFLNAHHAIPLLRRPGGRLITISSLAGRNGGHAGATAYAASKAALLGFARGLAKELGPDGITVNTVTPGFIEATPFHDTFTSAESKEQTLATIPVGRAGVPSDVAGAVAYLASPAASFVSGAVLDVNGAQYFG